MNDFVPVVWIADCTCECGDLDCHGECGCELICPCGGNYGSCGCPGPTQDGVKYEIENGILMGKITYNPPMKVLVACESSGVVRDWFKRLGHDATSCDLLPTEKPGKHYQGDVTDILDDGWDLIIAHPPCTYLNIAAAWAFNDPDYDKFPDVGYHQKVKEGTLVGQARRDAQDDAIEFVKMFMECNVPKVAIENPVGAISSRIRKPDQYVQPYEYGDDASKKTGLWLKGLPLLEPTNYVEPRIVNGKKRWANQTDSGQNNLTPGEDRWKERSKTYAGIAQAMAIQWGGFVTEE